MLKETKRELCPIEITSNAALEAVLFTSGDPVTYTRLKKTLGLTQAALSAAITDLQKHYSEYHRGLAVTVHEGRVQLVTAPSAQNTVKKMIRDAMDEDLSKVALEVLAIVAYRAPVSRTEVDAIRGVNCAFSLRNLLMKGLIERIPDPESPRTYLYRVTEDFLSHIGISHIDELPDFEILNTNPKIKQVQGIK